MQVFTVSTSAICFKASEIRGKKPKYDQKISAIAFKIEKNIAIAVVLCEKLT